MKTLVPPQIVIDAAVEQILAGSYKRSAPWLEDAIQRKRVAGRKYFNPSPELVLTAGAGMECVPKNLRLEPRPKIIFSGRIKTHDTEYANYLEQAERSGGWKTEHARHISDQSTELRTLQERINFLEAQLTSQRPYLQLYRLGAGSLFVALLSIVVWLLTGTGIPFHPIFAAGVIPASLGVIAMAFLMRSSKPPEQ
jgi:hypothetical protein